MNNNNNNPGEKQAEIYTYEAPWLIYACNWSVRFVISVVIIVHLAALKKLRDEVKFFHLFSREMKIRFRFFSKTTDRRCRDDVWDIWRFLTFCSSSSSSSSLFFCRITREWMNNDNNKNRYGAIKNYASGLDLSSRSTKIKSKSSRWTKRLVNS